MTSNAGPQTDFFSSFLFRLKDLATLRTGLKSRGGRNDRVDTARLTDSITEVMTVQIITQASCTVAIIIDAVVIVIIIIVVVVAAVVFDTAFVSNITTTTTNVVVIVAVVALIARSNIGGCGKSARVIVSCVQRGAKVLLLLPLSSRPLWLLLLRMGGGFLDECMGASRRSEIENWLGCLILCAQVRYRGSC